MGLTAAQAQSAYDRLLRSKAGAAPAGTTLGPGTTEAISASQGKAGLDPTPFVPSQPVSYSQGPTGTVTPAADPNANQGDFASKMQGLIDMPSGIEGYDGLGAKSNTTTGVADPTSNYTPNQVYNPTPASILGGNLLGSYQTGPTDMANQINSATAGQLNKNADNQFRTNLLNAIMGVSSGPRMTGFQDVNSRQFAALPGGGGGAATGAATGATGGGTAGGGGQALVSNPGQNLPQYTGATTGGQEAANLSRNLAINGTSNGVMPLYTGQTTGGQELANNARNLDILNSGQTTINQATQWHPPVESPIAQSPPDAAQLAQGGLAPYTTTINATAPTDAQIHAGAAAMQGGTPKVTADVSPQQLASMTQRMFDLQGVEGGANALNFSREFIPQAAGLQLDSDTARANQGLQLANYQTGLYEDNVANAVKKRQNLLALLSKSGVA